MDVIVHGTIGGYKVLYPTGGISPIGDVRFNSIDESPVGERVYSIAFMEADCVFTQYKIMRDGKRAGLSVGSIAFSVKVPNNQGLSGTDIKSLLDDLLEQYCRQYAPDNNLEIVNPDWRFINEISRKYKMGSKPYDNVTIITEKKITPAYLYYSSGEELKKYFDAPYQKEYYPFQQVFFVKDELQNKPENPLNVLNHDSTANLTGIIDLTKKEYRLNGVGETGNDITIEIRVDNEPLSNNDKITNRDRIKITYSRGSCYEPIIESGKLDNDNIKKYLIIDEERKKIEVRRDVNLEPRSETISFKITDSNDNSINDSDIKIGSSSFQKVKGNNHIHTFKGEDLEKDWTVTCRKGDFFCEKYIKPLEVLNTIVNLKLKKHKVIQIRAHYASNEDLFNSPLTVRMESKDGKKVEYGNISEIIFEDADISKIWTIVILGQENKINYSGVKENYCPLDEKDILDVWLKGKDKNSSGIWTGLGGVNGNSQQQENENNLSIVYKIERWFEVSKYTSNVFAGTLLVITIAFITLLVMIYSSKEESGENPPLDIKEQLTQYVEGDKLFLNELNKYQEDWGRMKPEIEIKDPSWFSIFGIGTDKEERDSTAYKEWHEVNQRIEEAITKRELVDQAKFAELKQFNYSNKQEEFKKAIEEINEPNYKNIKDQLGSNISGLTLAQIASSISDILNSRKMESPKPVERQEEPTGIKFSAEHPYSDPGRSSSVEKPVMPDENTKNIIDYLTSNQLNRSELENYRTLTDNNNLKKSIDLALRFWKLDGNVGNNDTYTNYQAQLAKDKNFKNSELKTLIDYMINNSKVKYVKDLPAIDQDKNFNQIKEILKK
jgi:hypothetical protein